MAFPLPSFSLAHRMPLKYWHINNFLPKHLRTRFQSERKEWKIRVPRKESATVCALDPRGFQGPGGGGVVHPPVQALCGSHPCVPVYRLLAFSPSPLTFARFSKLYSFQKGRRGEGRTSISVTWTIATVSLVFHVTKFLWMLLISVPSLNPDSWIIHGKLFKRSYFCFCLFLVENCKEAMQAHRTGRIESRGQSSH